MYLENLKSTKDIKLLSTSELTKLSEEVRAAILHRVSKHGGHSGPNFGTVELTVALHKVFDSPVDKFVFDVSHQSYAHKVLTGRKDAFLDEALFDTISGYTYPEESEHDFFHVGHTSTSVSLACGLAKGRDLKGSDENIVAIIGDGSLSGGEAFEGLNNVIEQGSKMIVVVNDNDMSIAENYGGYYHNLEALKAGKGVADNNFFKALGFIYYYVEDGHDMDALITAFEFAKQCDTPVVIHVHTVKGKGIPFIEQNKEKFHAGGPFDVEKGEYLHQSTSKTYADITAEYLLDAMANDPKVVAISAATPTVVGMNPERRKRAGKQFVDVGIAEEHAIAFASGIAKNGGKPVFGVLSTFVQRAYDQISQDLALNSNPAVILVSAASIHAMKDATHLGIFDIPLLSNIPNLVYLAPATKEEYLAMLEYALHQNEKPIAIRVPAGLPIETNSVDTSDYSLMNQSLVTHHGAKVAIFALGNFYGIGKQVLDALKQHDIHATLVHPKFISGLDKPLLDKLKTSHDIVITLEDGIIEGGYGSKIASYYGPTSIKVKNYGFEKRFYDRYDVDEVLHESRIKPELIIEDILSMLE